MRYEDRTDNRESNGGNDAETIQREIDHTRSEMDRTLEAIESKLSPSELFSEILAHFRSSEGGDAGSKVSDVLSTVASKLKSNPIPTALIGIGALALVKDVGPSAGEMKEGTSGARDKAKRLATSTAGDDGGGARARASEAVGSAKGAARGAADRAGDVASSMRESVARGTEQVRGRIEEDPLVLGALGVALGAALGAGIPRTRYEDETFGEKRDQLFERAKEVSRDAASEAREVAGEAASAAKQQAGSEGIDIEHGSAGQAAQATAQGARRVAESAGRKAKAETESRMSSGEEGAAGGPHEPA